MSMKFYSTDETNLDPGAAAVKEASLTIQNFANSTENPVNAGVLTLCGIIVTAILGMSRGNMELADSLYSRIGREVGEALRGSASAPAVKEIYGTGQTEAPEPTAKEPEEDVFTMQVGGATEDEERVMTMANVMASLCAKLDEDGDAVALMVSLLATAGMKLYRGDVDRVKLFMDQVHEVFTEQVPNMRALMEQIMAARGQDTKH